MKETIEELNKKLSNNSPENILIYFLNKYKGSIAFSTSLGAEDQALTNMIVKIDPSAEIFTLDTGRLFPESYDLIERTNKKFRIKIKVYFPFSRQIESMIQEHGVNLFYESVEKRKLCCHYRKKEPLKRALQNKEAWISGIRKEQSDIRQLNELVEWDPVHKIIKVNPLINWTEKQVWDYIDKHNIPVSPLHKKGFKSIGCQPCTRAIQEGEDFRQGRWWWEDRSKRECGINNEE